MADQPSSSWRLSRTVDESISMFSFKSSPQLPQYIRDVATTPEINFMEELAQNSFPELPFIMNNPSHLDEKNSPLSNSSENVSTLLNNSFESSSDDSSTDKKPKRTMCIQFDHLSYSVPTYVSIKKYKNRLLNWIFRKKVNKRVLDGITGCLKSGDLVAVMGSSGAGKSTFLDVMCNRVTENHVEGELLFNGIPVNDDISRDCFGYVWQEDTLHEHLTVRETLTFVYELRFGTSSLTDSCNIVNLLLKELGLIRCADTQVGGKSFRGISGGERKRLSIGIELISDPYVLYLDECTTGLDSKTAYQIVLLLRKLADKGKIIVLSIHQPQLRIYKLFDKILLLAKGGRVAYFGDGRESAVDYFHKLGFECPTHTTPTDHFVDLIDNNKKQKIKQDNNLEDVSEEYFEFESLEIESQVEYIVQSYNVSDQYARNQAEAQYRESSPINSRISTSNYVLSFIPMIGQTSQEKIYVGKKKKEARWIESVSILFRRHFIEFSRNRSATFSRLLQSIIIAVLLGAIYRDLGSKFDQKSAIDRRGVFFFLALQQGILGLISVLNLFLGWERVVFRKEYFSSLYDCKAYYLSKVAAEAPFQISSPLLFGVISYFLMGFNHEFSWNNFSIFMSGIFVSTLVGQSMGMFISVLTPNLDIANMVCPAILGLVMLSGGYLKNVQNFPVYLRWISGINFVTYSNDILSYNGLKGLVFTCDLSMNITSNSAGATGKLDPSSILSVFNPNSSISSVSTPCLYSSGDDLLQSLGLGNVSVLNNFLVLVAMMLCLHLMSFLGLRKIVVGSK